MQETRAWHEHLTEGEKADFKALHEMMEPHARKAVNWYVRQAGGAIEGASAARFLIRLASGTTPRKAPPYSATTIGSACIELQDHARDEGWLTSRPGTIWGWLEATPSALVEARQGEKLIANHPRIVAGVHGRCARLLPYRHPGGGIIGMCDTEVDEMRAARSQGLPFVLYAERPQTVHVVGVGNVDPSDPRHPLSGKPEAAVTAGGRYVLPTSPIAAQNS